MHYNKIMLVPTTVEGRPTKIMAAPHANEFCRIWSQQNESAVDRQRQILERLKSSYSDEKW
jgi:hypothetical protein